MDEIHSADHLSLIDNLSDLLVDHLEGSPVQRITLLGLGDEFGGIGWVPGELECQRFGKGVRVGPERFTGVAEVVGAQEQRDKVRAPFGRLCGALRELEARVREELQWQIYRNALTALVPALDDLELVLAHERHAAGGRVPEGSILEALEMVRQKMADGLRALGLEEIAVEPGVTRFDPAIHQVAPTDLPAEVVPESEVPRGTVLMLRRPGYRFMGKVLRPPQVMVKV